MRGVVVRGVVLGSVVVRGVVVRGVVVRSVVVRLSWLSGRALAAQARGLLGSISRNCQPFHLPLLTSKILLYCVILSQLLSYHNRGSYNLQRLNFCNHRARKLEEASDVAMALTVHM